MKGNLRRSLPLSLKLLIKRFLVRSIEAPMRGGAFFVRLARRIHSGAVRHGLDPHRAWDVNAVPRDSVAEQYGAIDFLLLMEAMLARNDRIPAPDRAIRTSIILLCYNKIELTFQCLRSLLREVDLNQVEIIVVNNASTDETKRVLSYFDGYIRLVNLDVNQGCVGGNNEGARHARGKYLVFLNNDTVVLPGWLKPLVETVDNDPQVGAAGSMFIYPDGRLQEAGGIVWQTGEAYHYGWGKSPEDRRFNFAREVDYCTSASLLVRKELFDRLGGFDPIYAPISYEDVDICFGVRSLGYKVVYQPLSRITHFEGATVGTDTRSGFKRYQVLNQPRFYKKWRDVLERDHYPYDPKLIERAANRKRGPYVLVIDDRFPTPGRDAGSARMAAILKGLTHCCKPVFTSVSKDEWPDEERQLWKVGVETARIVDYRRLIKERGFHTAVVSRPLVAQALIPAIRRADRRIKIVFDMVDAHFIRLQREFEVSGDPKVAEAARRYRKLEVSLARASDLIWCNSSEDKRVMEQEAPGKRIEVIPTIHELHGRGKPFTERQDLLFVGNLAHRPNSDAVHFLLKEIFPLIERSLPDVKLFIVGDNVPAEIAAYANANIRVTGYVADITPLFENCRVFLAPVRFGAGVKGKVGESMSYGLPVVTTSIGAEGFGLTNESNAMIAEVPADFAAAAVRLYSEDQLWQALAANSYEHIKENFTPDVIAETINSSIDN
jgi:GT2 family glycosyltransferase